MEALLESDNGAPDMAVEQTQEQSDAYENGNASDDGRSDNRHWADEDGDNEGSLGVGDDPSSMAQSDVTQLEPHASIQGETNAVPLVNYPCMRGRLIGEGSNHRCAGLWAMSKDAHSITAQTSPFEFRLIQAATAQLSWPVSGKYIGWFMIKQLPPKHPLKIEDREITLIFEKAEHGYTVSGFGLNKFGRFSMSGTMTDTGEIELFRIYQVKKTSQARGGAKRGKRAASSQLLVPNGPILPRRQVRGANDSSDFDKLKPEVTRPPIYPSEKSKVRRTFSAHEHGADRPKRMSEHMKRCSDILKLLQKHPHSMWFREPVDPIKLGVPDYFDIIKEPMDFGTIQLKLDMQEYDTPESFAEHMRLVFRNAVTYNTLRTSPVHVAARELAAQFEDKYRTMMSQLGSGVDKYGKKGKNKGKLRPSHPAGSIPMDETLTRSSDPHMLEEMQRRMDEMQRTIYRLETEIKTKERPQPVPGAPLEPLTFEEKRILIQHINKLSPEKLEKVVEIVKDALPSSSHTDEEDDVEIPLDNLDTLTLRKLQSYVETCIVAPQKRKRPPLARQSSTAFGPAVGAEVVEKRSKTSHLTQNGNDSKELGTEKTPFMGFLGGLDIAADASGTDDSDNDQNESEVSPGSHQVNNSTDHM